MAMELVKATLKIILKIKTFTRFVIVFGTFLKSRADDFK